MQQVQINIGADGPEIHVRETETPGTWGLTWTGVRDSRQTRRMLRATEDVVLPRGGERISLRCGEDEEVLRTGWTGTLRTPSPRTVTVTRWTSSFPAKTGSSTTTTTFAHH